MSRRKAWLPSSPKLVRFKRIADGKWQFYFPGFRSIQPKRWEVERVKREYRISARGVELHMAPTLAEARAIIAQHYEYLPK